MAPKPARLVASLEVVVGFSVVERNSSRTAQSGPLPHREPNEWLERLWIVAGAVLLMVVVTGGYWSFEIMTGYPKLMGEMFDERPATKRPIPTEANGATNKADAPMQ